MHLPEEIWRATDEARLERAARAIMGVPCIAGLYHCGILETEQQANCRARQPGSPAVLPWRQKVRRPREIPGAFGD